MGVRDPAYPLASAPFADSLRVDSKINFHAHSMLLILDPRASVLLLSRLIGHSAFTLASSFVELPGVYAAIFIDFRPLAIHVGIFELSSVRLLHVGEVVHAMALENTVGELAFVVAAVGPFVPPGAMFLALDEFTLVPRIVRQPSLYALPMLAIIVPLTLITVPVQVLE